MAAGMIKIRAGRAQVRRRRTVVIALALSGALVVGAPAVALDDIRDTIDDVKREEKQKAQEQVRVEKQVGGLASDLEHTSAELMAADEALQATAAKVAQARVDLDAAEREVADAEAEAGQIETELALAYANEDKIQVSLERNTAAQEKTRSVVGAIARESYQSGGLGNLAVTLDALGGADDVVREMAMARTVIRVQDDTIERLSSQQAQEVAEQDRLAGVRQDIALLLAQAEANVLRKEEARAGAERAKLELEALEDQQEKDQAALAAEKAELEEDLALAEAESDELKDELALLAQEKYGLEVQAQEEQERIQQEEERREAAAEAARLQAAEERAAREESARREAAQEEAARQQAAAEQAKREQEAAEQAGREQEAAEQAVRREAAEEEAARQQAAAEQAEQEQAAAEQAKQEQASEQAEQEQAPAAEDEREQANEQATREDAERTSAPPAAAPAASLAPPEPAREPAPEPSGILSPPVTAPTSSEFGRRMHPVLGYVRLHAGLDYAGSCRTPVYAAADGSIIQAGYSGGGGNKIVLDHGVHRGVNLTTSYLHLDSFAVTSGEVSHGDVVGYVGTTGVSTGCHLHFETRENGTPVNPRSWL